MNCLAYSLLEKKKLKIHFISIKYLFINAHFLVLNAIYRYM